MMGNNMKKMMIVLVFFSLLIVLLSFSLNLYGSERRNNDEWNKLLGGYNSDGAQSIALTEDEGYIIGGLTKSYGSGSWDVWLIKTDEDGNMLWNRTFGGKEEDSAESVIQTKDGGYLLCGYTFSFGTGSADIWIIKTDDDGNMLWNKTFGGENNDYGQSIIQTNDGGYALIATTLSFGSTDNDRDIWLIKTDGNGDIMWDKIFGGSGIEWGSDLIQTNDGGYCIVGSTASYGAGGWDVWLLKLDENGDVIWEKTIGDEGMDDGSCIEQTRDMGFIITGSSTSYSSGGWNNALLIKTDQNGNTQWINVFGDYVGKLAEDAGNSVIETQDSYLIAGITSSYDIGAFDAWLLKIDKKGNEIWNKTFGGRERETANCVLQAKDGSYIILGETNTYGQKKDAWLIKCQDYPPPEIKIERPKPNYLYLFGKEILPLRQTIILGGIIVTSEVYDLQNKIDRVEYYLTGQDYETEPRAIIHSPPFNWEWTSSAFGLYEITAGAYYGNAGSVAVDTVNVRIFNI